MTRILYLRPRNITNPLHPAVCSPLLGEVANLVNYDTADDASCRGKQRVQMHRLFQSHIRFLTDNLYFPIVSWCSRSHG